MEQIYVITKAIQSVELASLMKKGEYSIFIAIWFRRYTIICEGSYMHTGRESHVHVGSNGDGYRKL